MKKESQMIMQYMHIHNQDSINKITMYIIRNFYDWLIDYPLMNKSGVLNHLEISYNEENLCFYIF